MPIAPKSRYPAIREGLLSSLAGVSKPASNILDMLLPNVTDLPFLPPVGMPIEAGWMLPGGRLMKLLGSAGEHSGLAKKLTGLGTKYSASKELLRQGAIRARPSAMGGIQNYEIGEVTPSLLRRIEDDLLALPQKPTAIFVEHPKGTQQIPWRAFEDAGFDLSKLVR